MSPTYLHLKECVKLDLIPSMPATRVDYGFYDISMQDQGDLVGLYKGMMELQPEFTWQDLHMARKRGNATMRRLMLSWSQKKTHYYATWFTKNAMRLFPNQPRESDSDSDSE